MIDPRETTASRRQHPRFSVNVQVTVTVDGVRVSARTRDISRSGVCVISLQEIPSQKEIGLELVLTFGGGGLSEPLNVVGRVAWCTAMFGAYQVGLMFIKLDAEQSRNLDMFIGFLDGSLNAGELFGGDDEPTEPSQGPGRPVRRLNPRRGEE
jgi:hypothetical protein